MRSDRTPQSHGSISKSKHAACLVRGVSVAAVELSTYAAVELSTYAWSLTTGGAPIHAAYTPRVHEAAQQTKAAGTHREAQDAGVLQNEIRTQGAEVLDLGGRDRTPKESSA